MRALNKFQKSLIDAAFADRESWMTGGSSESKAFQEAFKNHLLDLPGPRYANLPLSPRKAYLFTIFDGFSEIVKSLGTLEDIQFYVARFPFRTDQISAERYLQFHVEAYLAEIYLLKERIDKFLKLVKRQHRGDSRHAQIHQQAGALLEISEKTLKGVVITRHAHTHQGRFKDDGISRLGTIGLLARRMHDRKLRELFKGLYRETHLKERKRWRATISSNNVAVRRLLDVIFRNLQGLLFDRKSGQPKFPSRLAAAP
jgi:hypothetical protein